MRGKGAQQRGARKRRYQGCTGLSMLSSGSCQGLPAGGLGQAGVAVHRSGAVKGLAVHAAAVAALPTTAEAGAPASLLLRGGMVEQAGCIPSGAFTSFFDWSGAPSSFRFPSCPPLSVTAASPTPHAWSSASTRASGSATARSTGRARALCCIW